MRVIPPGSLREARARIEAEDKELHAFISLTSEHGDGPVLAVKDNIDVRGCVTTAGSGNASGKSPAMRDAEVVARLRDAGYRVVGKANLHEHGLGSTSQNPHFGAVRNPHDRTRIAGGSSGGSVAAVVAGLCDLGLGTDTGGSVRIPSALCGAVGMRPTFGKIPTDGVVPLAHTLDTVGPIALDVAGVHRALRQLGAVPPEDLSARSVDSLRLITPDGWVAGLDEGVSAAWDRLVPDLEPVRLGELEEFVQPGLVTLYSEAATNHGKQLREEPDTLGDDVRHLLREGSTIPATEYIEAQLQRVELGIRLDRVLEGADALVVPTTRCVAPKADTNPLELRDLLTRFTRPFALTGHPVLALPVRSPGLPVGVQLVGRRNGERELLEVGAALEAAWA